jgi:hypothetical protein
MNQYCSTELLLGNQQFMNDCQMCVNSTNPCVHIGIVSTFPFYLVSMFTQR